MNSVNTKIRSQAVLEYTILFAVVLAALIVSVMFVNVSTASRNQFNSDVAVITGESSP